MKRETPTGDLVLVCDTPRDRWQSARQHMITATDVTAIAGLSNYASALDVYIEKRATSVIDSQSSEAAHWGHLLEEPVAQEWARRHGAKIRRVGLLRHCRHHHHGATLDRLVVGWSAPLEVKTRSAWVGDQWEDGLPDSVQAQTQWQMHVSGFEHAYIAALVGGQTFKAYEVTRDQDVIDYLIRLADELWSHVKAGQPPHLDPHLLRQESLDRLHPDRAGAVEVDPVEARELLSAYRRAQATEAAAKAEKDAAKLGLVQLLGDADTALIEGQEVFTYRQAAPGWKADARRIARHIPEAVAAGLVHETPGSRRIHLSKERA